MKNMTDNRRMISLEIDTDLLDIFDRQTHDLDMTRSDAIRALIYAFTHGKMKLHE